MRILHVIPSVSPLTGGPTTALAHMVSGLKTHDVDCEVVASDDGYAGPNKIAEASALLGAPVHLLPKKAGFYTWTPDFADWAREHLAGYDLVHIHALFSHLPIAAGRAARLAGKRYIVTPHGIANRHGMRHKPVRKALSFRLFDRTMLEGATLIHMTSRIEQREFEDLSITRPTKLIPLPVDLPPPGDAEAFFQGHPELRDKKIALFLGRINPIKHIEALIDAIAVAQSSDLRLVIAGTGEDDYVASLKQRAIAAGVDGSILWLGFISGAEKANLLAAADCVALVSRSESFGMSALEATAAGLPIVLSKGVAIAEEIAASGFGTISPTDAEPLAQSLVDAAGQKTPKFSRNARAWVATNFSVDDIGRQMAALYAEALA